MTHSLPMPVSLPRAAISQSLLGLAIWSVTALLLEPGWAPALLMFGPLVLFPLLFEIWGDVSPALRRLASLAFLPVIASYACAQSPLAAVLALPWLAFTLLLFFHRLMVNLQAREYVIILIKGYLIVGASWLVLARFGHVSSWILTIPGSERQPREQISQHLVLLRQDRAKVQQHAVLNDASNDRRRQAAKSAIQHVCRYSIDR